MSSTLVTSVAPNLSPSVNATNDCFDDLEWFDFFNDTCEWYVINDEPGCPNYGPIANNENTITANDAWYVSYLLRLNELKV